MNKDVKKQYHKLAATLRLLGDWRWDNLSSLYCDSISIFLWMSGNSSSSSCVLHVACNGTNVQQHEQNKQAISKCTNTTDDHRNEAKH